MARLGRIERCPKRPKIGPSKVVTKAGKGHFMRKIDPSGALGEIRTHDLCLRRAALYPLSYKRVSDNCGVAAVEAAVPIGTRKTTPVTSAGPATWGGRGGL